MLKEHWRLIPHAWAIMVAGVWNILREEGHSDIHAGLSQCSNSIWDYGNTNCFVCFSSEGLLAHSGSHFVWTDRLGSLILFFSSLRLLLLTLQWLKPLGLGYLWKTEVAPELCNQNKQWLQSYGISVECNFLLYMPWVTSLAAPSSLTDCSVTAVSPVACVFPYTTHSY